MSRPRRPGGGRIAALLLPSPPATPAGETAGRGGGGAAPVRLGQSACALKLETWYVTRHTSHVTHATPACDPSSRKKSRRLTNGCGDEQQQQGTVLLCGRCPHKSGTCAAFVATVQRAVVVVVVVEVVEVKEPTEFLKLCGCKRISYIQM